MIRSLFTTGKIANVPSWKMVAVDLTPESRSIEVMPECNQVKKKSLSQEVQ